MAFRQGKSAVRLGFPTRRRLGYPRDFYRILLGRVTTSLGYALAPLSSAFALLDLTGSAVDVGIVVGARSSSYVAFVVLGGAIADRYSRRPVLIVSCLVGGCCQLGMSASAVLGTVHVAPYAILAAVTGVASAFSLPAAAAATAEVTPQDARQRANAVARLAMTTATVTGTVLAGGVAAFTQPAWGLCAAGALVVCAAGFFRRITEPAERPARPSLPSALREGWREFSARTWVWVIVLAFALMNAALSASVQVLGPILADQEFGRPTWGIVLAAQSLGLVTGGLIALRFTARRPLLVGLTCAGTQAFLPLALGLRAPAIVLVATAFCVGAGVQQFSIAWLGALQSHIPADLFGRVYSYDVLLSSVAVPVMQFSIAPISAALGAHRTLVILGCLITTALLLALMSRSVRTVDRS
ncbi:MFS transporter [Nonomuraea sp. NPDC050691]|uniref:MFS transporter n=1 Tax=Nonomuraea sp. NPDC050691 TaxID=3155661 RepID=UPI0033EA397E